MDELFGLAVEEQDSLTEQLLRTCLSERKIVINEDIDEGLIEDVILYILKWNKEDIDIIPEKRTPIRLYINSVGGNAVIGMNLIAVMKASITPIVTVGFGTCASMAAYILTAGSERICFEHTVVLYHDGQSGYMASGNKGKDIQKFYDQLEERITSFVVESTFMDNDYLDSIKDREKYMFADEAKEHGIVDKIIGRDVDITYIL